RSLNTTKMLSRTLRGVFQQNHPIAAVRHSTRRKAGVGESVRQLFEIRYSPTHFGRWRKMEAAIGWRSREIENSHSLGKSLFQPEQLFHDQPFRFGMPMKAVGPECVKTQNFAFFE
ncbi:hypothetical protein, partial [Candidatus Propionivibrio aalborgensis]|uniref:hypothetical protein n=1 Tax=Candidatus Propionivibrio aalborgensis TaxID=1860101 RepID=UPI001C90D857